MQHCHVESNSYRATTTRTDANASSRATFRIWHWISYGPAIWRRSTTRMASKIGVIQLPAPPITLTHTIQIQRQLSTVVYVAIHRDIINWISYGPTIWRRSTTRMASKIGVIQLPAPSLTLSHHRQIQGQLSTIVSVAIHQGRKLRKLTDPDYRKQQCVLLVPRIIVAQWPFASDAMNSIGYYDAIHDNWKLAPRQAMIYRSEQQHKQQPWNPKQRLNYTSYPRQLEAQSMGFVQSEMIE